MTDIDIKSAVEAALLSADKPLTLSELARLFDVPRPEKSALRQVIETLQADYENRGVEIKEVASGYCVQVREPFVPMIKRLERDDRPPRYSRALLETLALIAYRQPITRSEVEAVRGVAVSTHIIKTLMDREWVRIVGHREVPGRPALFATTKSFLDYFNLKRLSDLPPLEALNDLEEAAEQLELPIDGSQEPESSAIVADTSDSNDVATDGNAAIENSEVSVEENTDHDIDAELADDPASDLSIDEVVALAEKLEQQSHAAQTVETPTEQAAEEQTIEDQTTEEEAV